MELPVWLDDLVPLLDPTAPPRVITLREAEILGYPFHVVRRLVRRDRWQRLAPGVYCTAPPAGRIDHLAAAVKHGGGSAVVSGTAALREFGVRAAPVPSRELLLVPLDCGARSHGRIVVRRTPNLPEACLRPGPALAPVARAAVDHARTLPCLDDVAPSWPRSRNGKWPRPSNSGRRSNSARATGGRSSVKPCSRSPLVRSQRPKRRLPACWTPPVSDRSSRTRR
ncbi:MAG: hypothetical protein DLM58_19460 [Pseudonocardiales bacterium]|nr:MAG: hypothetical protein DLM58_19460 [Pseudonocardiales bacterium]